jgi:hypothetical protein
MDSTPNIANIPEHLLFLIAFGPSCNVCQKALKFKTMTKNLSGNNLSSVRALLLREFRVFVAEFQFRYNNRENSDTFGTVIGAC